MKVWDAPTRLFHWAIVLTVFLCWLTVQFDWMTWHVWSGYAVFVLLLFRLGWGVIGSDTARFRGFLRGPLAALRHLAEFPHRDPDTQIGHNAAGGWMVLVILALLALQVGTGLCANDQVMTEGPFAEQLGQETSDWLTHIHRVGFTALEAAVLLHIAAVFAYWAIKRHNLIGPMITGVKQLPAGIRVPRMRGPATAAAILAAAVVIVAYVVS